MAKQHTTIRITLDENGDPLLIPQYGDDCYDPSNPADAKACGWTKFDVEWEGDEGLWWKIVFDKSPFRSGERFFESSGRKKARVKSEPEDDEYPYTIVCKREGKARVVTPKIVIRDSGEGFIQPRSVDELAEALDELAEQAALTARMARYLSDAAHAIAGGSDEEQD